jgi:hypothetical protein
LVSLELPQANPFAAVALLTQPRTGSQESTVQGLLSSQLGAGPPTHSPAPPQASAVVQAFPSLHGVSSAALGFEQEPVCGSQTPAT